MRLDSVGVFAAARKSPLFVLLVTLSTLLALQLV